MRDSEKTPENTENSENVESVQTIVDLDSRFGESNDSKQKHKCGEMSLSNRIVGGELCEIDK